MLFFWSYFVFFLFGNDFSSSRFSDCVNSGKLHALVSFGLWFVGVVASYNLWLRNHATFLLRKCESICGGRLEDRRKERFRFLFLVWWPHRVTYDSFRCFLSDQWSLWNVNSWIYSTHGQIKRKTFATNQTKNFEPWFLQIVNSYEQTWLGWKVLRILNTAHHGGVGGFVIISFLYLRFSSISRFSAECDRLVPPVPKTLLTFVRTRRRAVSVNLFSFDFCRWENGKKLLFLNGERNEWSNNHQQIRFVCLFFVFRKKERKRKKKFVRHISRRRKRKWDLKKYLW